MSAPTNYHHSGEILEDLFDISYFLDISCEIVFSWELLTIKENIINKVVLERVYIGIKYYNNKVPYIEKKKSPLIVLYSHMLCEEAH